MITQSHNYTCQFICKATSINNKPYISRYVSYYVHVVVVCVHACLSTELPLVALTTTTGYKYQAKR